MIWDSFRLLLRYRKLNMDPLFGGWCQFKHVRWTHSMFVVQDNKGVFNATLPIHVFFQWRWTRPTIQRCYVWMKLVKQSALLRILQARLPCNPSMEDVCTIAPRWRWNSICEKARLHGSSAKISGKYAWGTWKKDLCPTIMASSINETPVESWCIYT